jgi:hypothetical protein
MDWEFALGAQIRNSLIDGTRQTCATIQIRIATDLSHVPPINEQHSPIRLIVIALIEGERDRHIQTTRNG